MSIINNAAWIKEAGGQATVGPAEVGKPGPGELLIKNGAVAFNPVDAILQSTGFLVKSWPTIVGNDLAGEIVEVGEGVTGFSQGQRVLAHPLGLANGRLECCSFQNYTVVSAVASAPIPDNMSFEEATVIPLALSTAAAGLYPSDFLGLPFPSSSPKSTGKTLIVWGGSSSVGSSAIQLAVASGFDVITTASSRNAEFCKSIGAKTVFDYNSDTITEDLIAATENTEVAGAFAAVTTKESVLSLAKVLEKKGGGAVIITTPAPDGVPESIKTKQMMAALFAITPSNALKAVYTDFLPGALASGQYKPAPPPEVVGKGLESIQAGFDRLKAGVSATKVVVSL